MAVTLCPLCAGSASSPFSEDRRRPYRRCERCALVFVPAPWRPSAAEERAEYDRHENHPGDAGYRRFLGRLATPLLAALPPAQSGLDFGCLEFFSSRYADDARRCGQSPSFHCSL